MCKRDTHESCQDTYIQIGSFVNLEYSPLGSANRASSTGAKRVNGPYSVEVAGFDIRKSVN